MVVADEGRLGDSQVPLVVDDLPLPQEKDVLLGAQSDEPGGREGLVEGLVLDVPEQLVGVAGGVVAQQLQLDGEEGVGFCELDFEDLCYGGTTTSLLSLLARMNP